MKKILRLSAVLFAALLLLSLFALPTGAKAETKYVEWKLSEDLETLTADGTVTYTYYGSEYDGDLFGSVIAYKEEIFHENKVEDPSGSSYRVYTVGENAIAYFMMDGEWQIYATEEARASLDAIGSASPSAFALMKESRGAVFDRETALALSDLGGEGVEMDVRDLKTLLVYSVMATDSAYFLQREWCLVYEIGGNYYALFVPDLDNSHFDADGAFSYRSGTVTLYPLPDDIADKMDLTTLSYWGRTLYEEDLLRGDADPADGRDTAITFAVILSLIPALVFTVIHGVKFFRESGILRLRRGILFAASGTWFLLSVALVAVLATMPM